MCAATRFRVLGCALLATVLTACSAHARDQDLAESITRAIYDDDLAGTTANFDDSLKKQVTRGELGVLSDRMHALGQYESLAPRSADPAAGRYEYDATFSNGSLLVQLRVDPDGKVAAYRVQPETVPTTASTSANG